MIDNIKGEKYIMYPRFIQMLLNDQVPDLPKDPADELKLNHMTSETLSRLNQYKSLKDDPEPRVKKMICKIANPNYVAPENDAWRHENSNSEDETNSLSGMHEKRLRYWFVKDRKRKRTPKVSPIVVAPKVVIKGKVESGSHIKEPAKKKSPPRLVDETVIPPADVIQGGVDLLKETLEDFLKKNDEAEAAKAAKDAEGVAHTDSSETESDTEPEIDTLKIGVGKIKLKAKPQKKKKDSDEEDSTYIPTPEETKKLRKKRKAVQTGVIPRNVRARKRSATVPEMQSGKAQEVQAQSTPEVQAESIPEVEAQNVKLPEAQSVEKPEAEKEKVPESPEYERVEKKGDDDHEVVFTGERVSTPPPPPENSTIHILDDPETSQPKKVTSPGSFEGFLDIRGEFTDDILPDDNYDMFHDGKIKDLTKKVSSLEKAKAKAEAECDELKKETYKGIGNE
ncbi:hypothetical protein HanPSC8_Chr08g0337011 [Helianthus annuus]|nr:hypothetical protein HanPSC8_Chr08g0337011 [Helianthus annuus]